MEHCISSMNKHSLTLIFLLRLPKSKARYQYHDGFHSLMLPVTQKRALRMRTSHTEEAPSPRSTHTTVQGWSLNFAIHKYDDQERAHAKHTHSDIKVKRTN